jgi:DNA-binding CsgD family transcriptional regulator
MRYSLPDLDFKRILSTAFVDSIVWVWFLQAAYESRFTSQIAEVQYFLQPQLDTIFWVSLATGIVLVCLRWDGIPRLYRIICPVVATCSVALLLTLSFLDLNNSTLDFLVVALFTVSYVGCQFLRVETLAKSENMVSLALTVLCSFVLYYLISIVMLIIPLPGYFIFILIAPLAFMVFVNKPLVATGDSRPVTIKSFFMLPNLLLVFLGIAGGLLAADGNTNTALSLSSLFDKPSPVYLLMVLVFMVLGILISFNYRLRKGMYFAMLNVMWIVGTLLGALLKSLLPEVPGSLFIALASIAGLAVLVSFIVFQDTWMRVERRTNSQERSSVEKLSREKGLTNREIEVLSLLLEGRSVPYIVKLLYISEGTARTHTKHIYTKLGVHSKQELIDYFQ